MKLVVKPTVIDLFCGAGGFSLGFIQAGFNVVCGVDSDPHALMTYYANLAAPDCKWVGEKPKRRGKEEKLSRNEMASWEKTVKVIICQDIREVFGWDVLELCGLEEVDGVIGSPPCGSFSFLGRRKVGDERDYLVFEFARLVDELQPKFLVMENVPALLSKKLPSGVKVINVLTRYLEGNY